jgi:hypothetical protein
MDIALKQNRTGIEEIFGRIHSPAEFSGLSEELTTFVRNAVGVEATLSQISTGGSGANSGDRIGYSGSIEELRTGGEQAEEYRRVICLAGISTAR